MDTGGMMMMRMPGGPTSFRPRGFVPRHSTPSQSPGSQGAKGGQAEAGKGDQSTMNISQVRQQFINQQNAMFDGKRMRKAVHRKTLDYNTSVIKYLQNRVWQRDRRDMPAIQPDALYQFKLEPPMASLENPINSVTTKFVRTSTNKFRCPIFCVTWTPEGRRLVTGASSGEFTLWNGLAFNFETILQAHDTSVRAMRWSHNDMWMVTADHAGFIKYWQSNMNNVKMYQGHKEAIRGISFCPTDSKFTTCADDGTVRVWDFMRGHEERILRGHGADVKSVDWHPLKALIASGSKDNQQPVKLWDPRSGQALATIHAHKNTVMDLKWNKNGNWLLTASRDHLIKLFDIRNMKEEVQVFKGHKKEATALDWHPTHEGLFASGGSDGGLMFWMVGCDREVGSMEEAHEGMVWSLAWHPLGHILASGSNDHSTKFWTRNRPGDTMRDKYNLNSLPTGTEQELLEFESEPQSMPSLPGMGLEHGLPAHLKPNQDPPEEEEPLPSIPGLDWSSDEPYLRQLERDTAPRKKVPYARPIPRNFENAWKGNKQSGVLVPEEMEGQPEKPGPKNESRRKDRDRDRDRDRGRDRKWRSKSPDGRRHGRRGREDRDDGQGNNNEQQNNQRQQFQGQGQMQGPPGSMQGRPGMMQQSGPQGQMNMGPMQQGQGSNMNQMSNFPGGQNQQFNQFQGGPQGFMPNQMQGQNQFRPPGPGGFQEMQGQNMMGPQGMMQGQFRSPQPMGGMMQQQQQQQRNFGGPQGQQQQGTQQGMRMQHPDSKQQMKGTSRGGPGQQFGGPQNMEGDMDLRAQWQGGRNQGQMKDKDEDFRQPGQNRREQYDVDQRQFSGGTGDWDRSRKPMNEDLDMRHQSRQDNGQGQQFHGQSEDTDDRFGGRGQGDMDDRRRNSRGGGRMGGMFEGQVRDSDERGGSGFYDRGGQEGGMQGRKRGYDEGPGNRDRSSRGGYRGGKTGHSDNEGGGWQEQGRGGNYNRRDDREGGYRGSPQGRGRYPRGGYRGGRGR